MKERVNIFIAILFVLVALASYQVGAGREDSGSYSYHKMRITSEGLKNGLELPDGERVVAVLSSHPRSRTWELLIERQQ